MEGNQLLEGKWCNLRVGDVVRVVNETYFPADLVILKSSDPKGRVFVETKSLDGETNLKTKFVPKELVSSAFDTNTIRINYESPNPYLSRFNGSMTVASS